MRKRIALALTGGSTVAALAIGMALIATTSASANFSVWHARPHSRHTGGAAMATANAITPVTNVNDQFQSGTGGWCVGGGNPCDGNVAAGDYGTIDGGIPSGFTNGGFGNYAPNTPALYKTKMALISGSTAANQGLGCQTTGIEGCTGPYYVQPGQGDNLFPSNGFTVTDDLYLDPSASVGSLSEVDPDVGLNTTTYNATYGYYGQDEVIAVCNLGSGSGYQVTFGHGSPNGCTGNAMITTAGWYRFVWIFSNVGGDVYMTQKVFAETSVATAPTLIDSSGAQPIEFNGDNTAEPTSAVGGLGYMWLPTLNVSGMPMANFAVQVGQHSTGHAW